MWVMTPASGKSWGVPPAGREADRRELTSVKIWWNMAVPTAARGDAGGRVVVNRNVHFHKAEHDGPLYSD